MDNTQRDKAILFKKLHEEEGLFIIPNPWDAGSAKMLAGLGFKAMATTSAGLAFSLGRADGINAVSREETLYNARMITAATNLPVAADLENGFGHSPETCAETILLAAGAGLVGGSIEYTTGNPGDPILPFQLSVERVKAAVAAARSLPIPFIVSARAENLIYGKPDLRDTIKRLQAYAEAGADVLFAPGLKTMDEVRAVISAVAPKPINVLVGFGGTNFTLEELEKAGVKRVSTGSSLARAAYGSFINASADLLKNKRIDFAQGLITYSEINNMFQ